MASQAGAQRRSQVRHATFLRACYALPGTNVACAIASTTEVVLTAHKDDAAQSGTDLGCVLIPDVEEVDVEEYLQTYLSKRFGLQVSRMSTSRWHQI
eukprot:105985-Rhodomonas_salina.1